MTTETMNAQQLAKIINVPLFADRGTACEVPAPRSSEAA